MNILIVEDDSLVRELLIAIVSSLSQTVTVKEAESVDVAWSIWQKSEIGLVLCDWNLQGSGSGLELARRIRSEDSDVPIFMVTGRGDRNSVLASHRAGLNGYIVKPFTPEDVLTRLTPFFKRKVSLKIPDTAPDWDHWLEGRVKHLDHLVLLPDAQNVMSMQWKDELPTAKTLAKAWKDDVTITTRLLSVANSNQMQRYGRSVSTLVEAITIMGVSMAIAQTAAILLNQGSAARLPVIQKQIEHYARQGQRVAEEARKIAIKLKLDPAPYYTAGLLHRLGEFALLEIIQECPAPDESLNEGLLDELLQQYSSRFGNAVKISWHLPLQMREFIGAVFVAPLDTARRDLLIMHLAGLLAQEQPDHEQLMKFKRFLGLDSN
ncbi:response regulator [Reinekea sp.]|jgi:DNA-binding response OmpR family regulator|uniref:response regulator n=1 Tax=Reinekea sp. TaxID=1970455 RepID=UPI003989688D